jgi:hypothetical protein
MVSSLWRVAAWALSVAGSLAAESRRAVGKGKVSKQSEGD